MKRLFIASITVFVFMISGMPASAQMPSIDNDTHHPDAFQDQQVPAVAMSDDQYERLGEQMMAQMMGDQHESMDKIMEEKMGQETVRQMHIAMGKRAQMMAMDSITNGGMMKMMGETGRSVRNDDGIINNVARRPMMYGTWGNLGIGSPFQFSWWAWIIGHIVFCIALIALIVLADIRLWQLIRKK